jgi:hypothetical protein
MIVLYIIFFLILIFLLFRNTSNNIDNFDNTTLTPLPTFNNNINYNLVNNILNFFKQGININYISYGNILNNNANTSINLPLIKTFKKLNELGQNISYNDIIAEMNKL